MKWDTANEPGIGWFRPFAYPHKFYAVCCLHDEFYNQLKAGTATKTLKQIDDEIYANMKRIANRDFWFSGDIAQWAKDRREARIAYKAMRLWAKYVRPELEKWKPGGGPIASEVPSA